MASTVFATVSTPGPPGPAGPPGTSPIWIVAAGAPSNLVGNNGDMYLNNSAGAGGGDVYGPKASNAWGSPTANIKGSTGATGATGAAGYSPTYIVQPSPPTAGQGNPGDMAINSATSDLYGPKTTVWGPIVANLKGQTGAQGPPGVAYTPRGAWAVGTTYAQGDMVSDANVAYISLQSGNVGHVPASSPTWWESIGAGSQTPWLTNIDGGGFRLSNTGNIAIGNSGAVLPDADAGSHLIVGSTTGTSFGEVTTSANTSATTGAVGIFNFANYANTGAEKRVAAICGSTDGAINSGATIFYNWNAGTVLESMRITHLGNVGIGTPTPSGPLTVVGADVGPGTGLGTAQIAGGDSSHQVRIGYNKTGAYGWLQCSDGSSFTNLVLNGAGGRVGIGTTTPQYLLDAVGGFSHFGWNSNGAIPPSDNVNGGLIVGWNRSTGNGEVNLWSAFEPGGAAFQFSKKTGASTYVDLVAIAMAGVGIGYPNPTHPLHILATATAFTYTNSTVYIQRNTGNSFAAFGISGVVAVQPLLYSPVSTDDWAFGFDNGSVLTEAMRIKSNGNVGIGIAAPTRTLTVRPASGITLGIGSGPTVSGSASLEALNEAASANIPLEVRSSYSVFAIGNVGVGPFGTGTPLTALSVLSNPTPVTFATANQITVCEASNNSGYRLNLGYASVSGTFYGVVQAIAGGSGAALMLNPTGGLVGIAKVPFYALDITGDCNVTGTFRVNGVAIGAGGSGVGLTAQASSATTVTNAGYSDIPGCSLTLTPAGRWLIIGMFDCTIAGSDGATVVQGLLNANGTQQGQLCLAQAPGGNTLRVTVAQQWMLVLGSGVVVKLQGYRPSGTSTSTIGTNTTITAIWISAS